MHEYLLDFVGGNRIYAGIICTLISLLILKYQLYYKKKYNPKLWSASGLMEWKTYIGIWAIIYIFLFYAYSFFFWSKMSV